MSSPQLTQMEGEEKLKELLAFFPREDARRMKARAFWLSRKKRQHARRRCQTASSTEDAQASIVQEEALCPITLTPHSQLHSPCVASDGCVYESSALEQWAQRNAISPISRKPLRFGVPLKAARRAVSSSES